MDSIPVQIELTKGKREFYDVPLVDKRPETFLRKSVILFGESGTG